MRTTTGFTAAVAALALLIAPLVTVSAAQAVPGPQLTGVTHGGEPWIDDTISAEFTVGVPYGDTVQAPACCPGYGGMLRDLPAWLNADIEGDGTVTFYGTPTAAVVDQYVEVEFGGSDGTYWAIEFWITVVPDATPTTVSVTSATFSKYTGVNLNATVSSSTSGGTVDFYLDSTLVGTGTVGGTGTASYTGAVPQSFVGSSTVVKAVFSGTTDFAGSTSTSNPSVYIYGDRVISGYFVRNGVGTAGEHIRLLTADNVMTSHTAVTGAAGQFEITLAAPTSLSDATATYVVAAVDSGYFHASGVGVESPTTFVAATATGDADWTEWINIFDYRDPTWTDQTLTQPRLGESYSDGVAADPLGSGSIIYTATGDLPAWVTLSSTTGALTSTGPTDQLAHTFTLRATSDFGYIEKQFTLQAGDAAVPPTFTDTTIAALQVGTPVADAIAATGDATITYSSTTLPPGLTLNAATGALTGTPTTAGDYTVTFTASNGVNPDATFVWEPTITAAPELDLVLNFAAGTTIEDADTEIGADGLKVGSTYTLYLHSTPVLLYTGTVDATGAFSQVIALPANTPVGAHELILTGIAPDGTVMTAHAWFTLLPNGRIGAISYAGPLVFALSFTGSDPLLPLGIASALLLAGFLIQRRGAAIRIRAVRVP